MERHLAAARLPEITRDCPSQAVRMERHLAAAALVEAHKSSSLG